MAREREVGDRPREKGARGSAPCCADGSPGGLCGARKPDGLLRSFARRRPSRFLIPLAVLLTFAILFVLWEVAERHLLPTASIGVRHALLTVRAAVVAVAAASIVYALMRRPQRQLSKTAEQLSELLAMHLRNRTEPRRFENPYLVHCREVLGCKETGCPMYNAPGERCWQVMALGRSAAVQDVPVGKIENCHECEVYRTSCPNKLIELGESFNNLMFLLEEEAKQVGRMRAQMVEKEKMVAIGQIASGIAHEIGNPLSSISSITQMLRRNGIPVAMTDQVNLIETHIDRITTIVRQLVTLARPSSDQWELMDVGETLAETIRLISFDRRARDIDIDFQRPSSLPRTFGLRGQLQQVFINLAINALDAMPDGGRLTIRTEARRGSIRVHIHDSGVGIATEIGRRIFEPFFTTKEPGHGTGLGLAVSYGIVQKHGGSIGFVSTPGKGTVFTVEIPVLAHEPDG